MFKTIKSPILPFLILLSFLAHAQTHTIIELPHVKPDSITWTNPEKEYYSKDWKSNAVTNVSTPTLIVYSPPIEKQNGTSVIIAPGGGIYALSMEYEGKKVAEWLNHKGITAFILKYRLVPTGDDGIKDLKNIVKNNNEERVRITKKLMPYATADGLNAISYIRTNSNKLGIDPEKIGFMGFSGGGCVLFGVVNDCTEKNKPNFLVPVYPGTDLINPKPNNLTPPTLFIMAANDQLIDATVFTSIFNKWHKAGVKTEMHMYANGGHGFGTWLKGLPVSKWLDRFYEWILSEKLLSLEQ
ncbi:alpha/beta hydrolase [uncultured Algibacter sp.]|uniref:alpha/beta hydrolase n=1 Tax=uncultured Algibacter sp. TaxID=298659 RepID=UPI0026397055|nr:alpha/beta hydrolase [uncultured Algibacter sp.]